MANVFLIVTQNEEDFLYRKNGDDMKTTWGFDEVLIENLELFKGPF